MRIGIVAPSCRIDEDVVARVSALAEGRAELVWHPQCFLSDGHFAGPDAARAQALLDHANDPTIDAIWFARGGYGACRIVDRVIDGLVPAARGKTYLGYSDGGTLLGALYAAGIGQVAHGPMPADIRRQGGEAAVVRALDWLVERDSSALEPSLGEGPAVAFNIVILAHLAGTRHLPDLAGHPLNDHAFLSAIKQRPEVWQRSHSGGRRDGAAITGGRSRTGRHERDRRGDRAGAVAVVGGGTRLADFAKMRSRRSGRSLPTGGGLSSCPTGSLPVAVRVIRPLAP